MKLKKTSRLQARPVGPPHLNLSGGHQAGLFPPSIHPLLSHCSGRAAVSARSQLCRLHPEASWSARDFAPAAVRPLPRFLLLPVCPPLSFRLNTPESPHSKNTAAFSYSPSRGLSRKFLLSFSLQQIS